MAKAIGLAPLLSLLVACTSARSGGGTGGAGGAGTGVGGSTGGGGSGAGGLATTGSGGSANGGTSGTGGAAGSGGATGSGGAGGASTACIVPPPVTPPAAGASDVVSGTLIQFNDNGAWSWYQDERVVVDRAGGKLIIGSDGNSSGAGGTARNGAVEAVIYDLAAKSSQRFTLGTLSPDDHNAPALLVRPDGKYVAIYAGHNQDCISYYRTFDGAQWGATGRFDWAPLGCDTTASTKVTYSNLWYMSAESRVYNFVRSVGTSPNMMISEDLGATWSYGGRLTSTPQVGYVAGYYKYWGNGVDRVDFVGTEAHPRDFDNSLYHGYVKGRKSYDSSDQVVDSDITDGTAPVITQFTKVFATGTVIKGAPMTHAWNIDLQRYDDGTIALLFKARADTNADDPDHRLFYARFDGTTWKTTYIGRAGHKLYASEQDYVGLGALHPNDPHTIYISTPIDPRDDTTNLTFHEIFQGTTCDQGATFTWTPITQKSTRDNLRPVVPAWAAGNTALLWWRGTYSTAQSYNAAVVGVLTTGP